MEAFKVLKKALGNRHYLAVAVVVSVTSVVLTILLPNWKLVLEILSSNGSFWEEIKTIVNLLGAFKTNFTAWARVYLVIISVLFGINVSIIIYYRHRRRRYRQWSVGSRMWRLRDICFRLSFILGWRRLVSFFFSVWRSGNKDFQHCLACFFHIFCGEKYWEAVSLRFEDLN